MPSYINSSRLATQILHEGHVVLENERFEMKKRLV